MPKTLNILLITGKTGPNYEDLVRAITARGHIPHTFSIADVAIRLEHGQVTAFFGDRPLSFFDIIIPRTIQKHLSLGRFVLQLASQEQFVLDACIAKRDTFGKVSQARAFLEAGILHPATVCAGPENTSSILQTISFPCIAKPVNGSQGNGVMLLKDAAEAEKVLAAEGTRYLFQEYLPITFDYRIFVVGGEALGGIRRHVAHGDFRTNASVGGRAEVTALTEPLRSLAVKAAALFGYDVAGVDIAVAHGQHYVLEVNRSPQWQAFKQATGIDPAEKIIAYAIKARMKAV